MLLAARLSCWTGYSMAARRTIVLSSARILSICSGSRAVADAVLGPEEIPDVPGRVGPVYLADRVAFGGAMVAQVPGPGAVRRLERASWMG